MHTIQRLFAALSIALVTQAVQAQGFSQFVVFGDSLSDDGNISLAEKNQLTNLGLDIPRRFTTNPGQVAVEDIAGQLGFQLTPSLLATNQTNVDLNAVDYAYGGAGINNNSEQGPIPTISTKVGDYLRSKAGQADPSALYSLWGGANDIFYHVSQLQSGNETTPQVQVAIAQAAGTEIGLINHLQQAGARRIIVFNLPDIGQTPLALTQGKQAQALLTGLSNQVFNQTLNAGLAGRAGVIPVDAYDLSHEIMDDPARYGFKNTTNPACGGSSLYCGPQGSGAQNPSGAQDTYAPGTQKTYYFADSVHPTTATHRALADAVLSELDAPGQISLLGEAPVASANAQMRALDGQIRQHSSGNHNRVFTHLGYTHQTLDAAANSPEAHSNNVNLTMGIDHPVTRHVSLGFAFGSGHASANIKHDRGGYHMTTVSGTGYAAYHDQRNYAAAEIGYSHLYFNDIKRRFPIGAAVRTESGSTDGNQLYGALIAGHRFRLTRHFTSGPFGRIEWQHIPISGYSEHGNDATAMRFGHIKHNATILSLGWYLRGNLRLFGRHIHPYAALEGHHDTQSNPVDVTAGLKDMNGQFTLPGYNPDNSWGSANVGISANLSHSVRGWIGYHGRFSDQSQSLSSVQLGLRLAL